MSEAPTTQTTQTPVTSTPSLARAERKSSPRLDVLRRLRRHPSAIAGGSVLLIILLLTLAAPIVAPYDPIETFPRDARLGPSADHWLGTDHLGRDIWSRVLYGGRISLMLGLIAVAIGGAIGTVLGLLAGYFRGYIEIVIMQFIDILLAFPGFLLALAAVAVLGTGINNVMIAVGIALVPGFARVVRSSTLTVREMTYVESARSVGVGNTRIMLRYILPNVLAPIMVLATVDVAGAILTGAALSFLGMGAQPPAAEWGLMVNEGRRFLRVAWWITTFPGMAIMISVIAINLIGDALRDVLDPRMRTS
jgi:peptide/nickel transport system permease protein